MRTTLTANDREALPVDSCMGGWCRVRDNCPNYAAASLDAEPAERLCEPDERQPIRVHKPAGAWEKRAAKFMARATPFDCLGAA